MAYEEEDWTSPGNWVKFEKIGDKVAGTLSKSYTRESTDFNGQPETQRILEGVADDGEDWTVQVKNGSMKYELGAALKRAGVKRPTQGDRIAIVFESTEKSKFPQPRKIFSVAYKVVERDDPAPVAAGPSSADDLL